MNCNLFGASSEVSSLEGSYIYSSWSPVAPFKRINLTSIKSECTHVLVFNQLHQFNLTKDFMLLQVLEINSDLCTLYAIFHIWMSTNKLDVPTFWESPVICVWHTTKHSKDSKKCKHHSPQQNHREVSHPSPTCSLIPQQRTSQISLNKDSPYLIYQMPTLQSSWSPEALCTSTDKNTETLQKYFHQPPLVSRLLYLVLWTHNIPTYLWWFTSIEEHCCKEC